MGEVIRLVPKQRYSLVIDVSRDGCHAYWFHGENVMWQYWAQDLNSIKHFANQMIDRNCHNTDGENDDPGTPIQGA